MKVKLKYLAIVWLIIIGVLVFVLTTDAKTTRPTIRNTAMKWSSYHAYKLLEDGGSVDADDVWDLIVSAQDNEKWAKRTVKKMKLAKLTPKNRVKKILRYISELYTYDISVKYIEDARRYRRANCSAYADTMYILCKAANIPVRYIIGYDGNACHAWCRVKIGKKWYWSDPTRNDGLNGFALSRKLWAGYHGIIDEW